jgi:hypothetical protein
MRWMRRVTLTLVTAVVVVLGMSATAQAAPPANVGWLYTQGKSGAVFFDADLAGYPSFEKITVCDNKSDGRGIVATVSGWVGSDWVEYQFWDPSNNGDCSARWDNYFSDGYTVYVQVCEYWGNETDNCATASGVA